MRILGIESSCDETSIAILDEHGRVHANLIASQIERHQPFGGVVPEIASREHLEHLMPLLRKALDEAGLELRDLNAIAVTSGPGLIGALLVGVAASQGLAYGLGIPLVTVNHLEGHIFSPYLKSGAAAIPLPPRFLSLVVSGGHSSIYDVRSRGAAEIRMLNRTRDDAAGEIFDKVGKFIGLPYPGGPHVERISNGGDPKAFAFAVAQFKDDSPDFSFSGLKSTAIRIARKEGIDARNAEDQRVRDFCASFQNAIAVQIENRMTRLWESMRDHGGELPKELGLAGGVAANGVIRSRVADWCGEREIEVRLPEKRYCTDNGAMIAFAGLQKLVAGRTTDPLRVKAHSRIQVGAGPAA